MTILSAEATTAQATRLFLQLIRPRAAADPYPTFGRLRELAPVLTVRLLGAEPRYVLSTFADCTRLLREPRFGPLTEEHFDKRNTEWRDQSFPRCMYRSMAFQSGVEHRLRRTAVTRHFTPRRTAEQRAGVIAIVDRLLDRLAAGPSVVDIEEELALPYSALVLGRLFGLTDDESLRLGRLTRDSGTVFELAATAPQRATMAEAGGLMRDELMAIAHRRRQHPKDDLLTDLARQYTDEEELASAVCMLFGAGFDSPASTVGLGTRLFLEHPAEAERLRRAPELAAGAGEEILRYEPPIQIVTRVALTDVRFGDVTIDAGSTVLGLVAGANRDPDFVTDPDRFDVTRTPIPGLGFGGGAHYCVGASLARLQAELLFPRLLSRFPDMALAGEPRYRAPGSALRGLDHLPVRLR